MSENTLFKKYLHFRRINWKTQNDVKILFVFFFDTE